jgi:hypothetical protein
VTVIFVQVVLQNGNRATSVLTVNFIATTDVLLYADLRIIRETFLCLKITNFATVRNFEVGWEFLIITCSVLTDGAS